MHIPLNISTMSSSLGQLLLTRRKARGLSREDAAELFSVDTGTVFRWERDTNRPTGKALMEALKREYAISQEELDNCFARGSGKHYVMQGYDYLAKAGIDEEGLLEKLIELDLSLIPRLSSHDEGSVEQWAPIFHASPFSWQLLTCDNKIVGYWHYVFLKDEYFELVKLGKLRDSELEPAMLEFPSLVDMSRNYKMYIIMLGVHGSHQKGNSGTTLVRSFVREFQTSTTEGLFVSELVAVAYTYQGQALCEDFGMTFIGRHPAARAGELAQIFHATGRQVAQQGHLSKYPKIARPYLKRFPSAQAVDKL